jgi:CheY-like chemotaxis protein
MTTSSQNEFNELIEGTPRELQEELAVKTQRERTEFTFFTSAVQHSDTGYFMRVIASSEGIESQEVQDNIRTTAEVNPIKPSTDTNPTEEAATIRSGTVLIVEDTVELSEVIEAIVQGMGFKTITATHARIGLERMKDSNPSILLLDINLPDISGWEFLKTIKETYAKENKKIPPIIVITANSDPANRLIGKLQEIHGYLIKPFTPDQIERVINDVLSGKRPPSANTGQ